MEGERNEINENEKKPPLQYFVEALIIVIGYNNLLFQLTILILNETIWNLKT